MCSCCWHFIHKFQSCCINHTAGVVLEKLPVTDGHFICQRKKETKDLGERIEEVAVSKPSGLR
jgi:hypothetical protein